MRLTGLELEVLGISFVLLLVLAKSEIARFTLRTKSLCLLIALILFLVAADVRNQSATPDSFPVHIRIDAMKTKEAVRPIWRFFGADEPNYAYLKNGRKWIADLGQLAPTRVYFRTHNPFTSGDGTPALKWGSRDRTADLGVMD